MNTIFSVYSTHFRNDKLRVAIRPLVNYIFLSTLVSTYFFLPYCAYLLVTYLLLCIPLFHVVFDVSIFVFQLYSYPSLVTFSTILFFSLRHIPSSNWLVSIIYERTFLSLRYSRLCVIMLQWYWPKHNEYLFNTYRRDWRKPRLAWQTMKKLVSKLVILV